MTPEAGTPLRAHQARHDDRDRVLEHEGQGEHGQGRRESGPVRPGELAEVEGEGRGGGGGGRGCGKTGGGRGRGRRNPEGDRQQRHERDDDACDEDRIGLVELPGRQSVARRAQHRREEHRREREEKSGRGAGVGGVGGEREPRGDDLRPSRDVRHEKRLVQEDVAYPSKSAGPLSQVLSGQAQQRAAAAARRAQEEQRRLGEEQPRGDRKQPGACQRRRRGGEARRGRDCGHGEHSRADGGSRYEGRGVEHGAGGVPEVVVEVAEEAAGGPGIIITSGR